MWVLFVEANSSERSDIRLGRMSGAIHFRSFPVLLKFSNKNSYGVEFKRTKLCPEAGVYFSGSFERTIELNF